MTASPLRSGSQPPSDPAALDRWLLKREEALAETLGREITRLVQRCVRAFSDTLPALTASGDYSVFDQIPVEWADILDERLLPDIEQTYFSGGLSTWASVPAEVAISATVAQGWAAIVNESAREFLSQRRNFLVGVGDNLFQGVIAQVDRALATGASTEDVKQSLERLGQFSEFRADTIARTEIQTAYASGNWNASVALGEFGPVEKEWLATNDARTRDTHRELDGTVVPFSQPFTVGGAQMMHPKDQSGPASEVVNCRCILLEYWPGDPRRDGSIVPEPLVEPESEIAQATGDDVSLLDELAGEERTGSTDSLPGEDEFVARLTDRERQSINTYTGSAYQELNENLRAVRDLTPEQATIVTDLDSAIAKAGHAEQPFVTYRGMTLPNPDVPGFRLANDTEKIEMLNDMIEQRYQPGARMTFGGSYASSSTSVAAPVDASISRANRGVVFEIQARRGAPINKVSKYDDEFEIILPRGQEYRIVGVERDASFYDFDNDRTVQRTIVKLVEVD